MKNSALRTHYLSTLIISLPRLGKNYIMIDYQFTPVPKWYFPLARELTHAENLLMLHIIESCYGTHEARERGFVDLSYTTLRDSTGLARSSIARALDGLRERGLITQTLHNVKVQRLSISGPRIVALETESGSKTLPKAVAKRGPHVPKSYQSSYINKNQESKEDDEGPLTIAGELIRFGFGAGEAGRLTLILTGNGRDLSQLQELFGYVALKAKSNPRGLLVKMIEENQSVPQIAPKPRQDSPGRAGGGKPGQAGATAWLERQKGKGKK